MPFTYHRTIHFQETDAAGVVYFANVLTMCHEAYEASLAEAGLDLRAFFSQTAIVVPITHAEVDFKQPMHCGDLITIHLTPHPINTTEFEVNYQFFFVNSPERPIINAITRHVSLALATHQRTQLPTTILSWLEQWSATKDPN